MSLLATQAAVWAVLALAVGLGVTLLVGLITRLRATPESSGRPRRPCRYCFWGHAELCESSSHIEGDDLVEVEFLVCTMCGLPQWTVLRGPVLREVG